EIARHTMTRNFRHIHPEEARITLIEGGPRLLPSFSEELSEQARIDLQELGVEVVLDQRAMAMNDAGVQLQNQFVSAKTILWAAGVRGTPVLETLHVPLDTQGRLLVEKDLSLAQFPNVFAVGDIAAFKQDDNWLPGVAQVALQQGRMAAKN